MNDSQTVVAILAGGAGSRIGGNKPQIRLGELTLLERALANANRWSDFVVVAARSPHQLGGISVRSITDKAGIEGPLAGLAAGLEWAGQRGAQALLTVPCDMPFLPGDLSRRLHDAIGKENAALAASGGSLHPVCGLWRAETLKQMQTYLDSGKRSLRGFAQHLGFVAVDWPTEPYDPFFNINSAADLDKAATMLAD